MADKSLMKQFFIEVGWDDGDPYSAIVWLLCNSGFYELRSFATPHYSEDWFDDIGLSALVQGY